MEKKMRNRRLDWFRDWENQKDDEYELHEIRMRKLNPKKETSSGFRRHRKEHNPAQLGLNLECAPSYAQEPKGSSH